MGGGEAERQEDEKDTGKQSVQGYTFHSGPPLENVFSEVTLLVGIIVVGIIVVGIIVVGVIRSERPKSILIFKDNKRFK
jgi:hypothetical protein